MSVANHKFTDMKQIEFQQSGSSEVNAMLLQPLLEKPSTYTVEVTNLQCTLGEEPFFPTEEWLFTLFRLPVGSGFDVEIDRDQMEDLIEKPFNLFDEDVFGSDDAFGYNPNTFNDGGTSYEFDNPNYQDQGVIRYFGASNPYRQSDCYSVKYYSTMDFVTHVAEFIQVYDRQIEAERYFNEQWDLWNQLRQAHLAAHGDLALPVDNPFTLVEPVPFVWSDIVDNRRFHISLSVDSGGRLKFWMSPFFLNHYCVLTSPLFQRVTGYPTFVGWYNGADHIQTVADLKSIQESDVLVIGNRVGDEFTEVRDVIPIHEGIDIRRKLMLEVSLPVSHTLAWDGDKETTRYVLQEFVIPSGSVSMSYMPYSGTTFMQQDQRLGPLVLLNGGSSLALKKLFEGQMQAFRIDIMVERRKWDGHTMKFTVERKRLDMGLGGFFYLKLLFSKETA